MAMVAVVDGVGIAGLSWQGLQGNGRRGPQRLQDGIAALARPLQQATEAMDGAPIRGRPPAGGGSSELLPQALWLQEPSPLLVLVEPIAEGLAQGCVARGGAAAMGRVPSSEAVQTLDKGSGQADTDDPRILRFWVRPSFPFAATKPYTM